MAYPETTLKRSEDLRRGEVLVITGIEPIAIAGFARLDCNRVLVKLAWAELCIIAHRGQQWRVLTASIRET